MRSLVENIYISMVLSFLLLATIPLFAQPPDTLWTRVFGGTDDDGGRSVQQTSDGGFIITGYTKSFGYGSSDVWLIKTDTSGSKQWSYTFGQDLLDKGNCVQ